VAGFERKRFKNEEVESSLDQVAWFSHPMIIYTLDCRSSRCAGLEMLPGWPSWFKFMLHLLQGCSGGVGPILKWRWQGNALIDSG
jgi:hypothetical protein